jgi:hypothetical protein
MLKLEITIATGWTGRNARESNNEGSLYSEELLLVIVVSRTLGVLIRAASDRFRSEFGSAFGLFRASP